MTETGYISRAGIVDRVEAVRNNGGEVTRLNVKVRSETEFAQVYYKDEHHVDEMTFSLAVDSGVNPGDLVSISMQFANPIGQRFQPALEASSIDEDDDVLEVMVEDGMVEETKFGNKTLCGDDGCTLDDCQRPVTEDQSDVDVVLEEDDDE